MTNTVKRIRQTAQAIDRTPEQVREIVLANMQAGRGTYEGLTSSEIGTYSRRLMFGENDEAFPSAEAWARIVD